MKFEINSKGKTRCPQCNRLIKLVHNETLDQYEISHCERKWGIFITKEQLEKDLNK